MRFRFPGRASLDLIQGEQTPGGLRVGSPTRIGSAAYRAGIAQDDVIRAIDGQTIGTAEQLDSALRRKKPGDRVTVTFIRRGREVKAEVALDDDPRFDIVAAETMGLTLTEAQKAFRASWLAGQ